MHKFATLFTALGAVSASPLISRQAGGWPAPEPLQGNNTYIHDPALIRRDDGKWFRLSTNGNIAIASADSVNGPWTYQGAMLPGGSVIHAVPDDGKGTQEIWVSLAPFLHHTIVFETCSQHTY